MASESSEHDEGTQRGEQPPPSDVHERALETTSRLLERTRILANMHERYRSVSSIVERGSQVQENAEKAGDVTKFLCDRIASLELEVEENNRRLDAVVEAIESFSWSPANAGRGESTEELSQSTGSGQLATAVEEFIEAVRSATNSVEQMRRKREEIAPLRCDNPEPIRIGLWPYIRTMLVLAWTAVRHPFSTTVIDATTGKVLREEFQASYQE